jgi:hypothetical protein
MACENFTKEDFEKLFSIAKTSKELAYTISCIPSIKKSKGYIEYAESKSRPLLDAITNEYELE